MCSVGVCGVCVCLCVSGNRSTKLGGTKSSEHTNADLSSEHTNAWCGAFMCWCAHVSRHRSTRTKTGGNKSSGHRRAVHPNFVHLLCEVCWCVCVCAVRGSANRSTKPSGKKPSGHRIAGHSMCVCVESVSVCVCANVRVDSNLVSTRSPVERFEWTASR